MTNFQSLENLLNNGIVLNPPDWYVDKSTLLLAD